MKHLWEKIVSWRGSNFGLKALALIIAVGLWLAGHRDTERAIEVAVEFRNLPADLMVMDNRVDYVVLRLMGPRTLVSTLDADNLKLSVDLNGAKSGASSYPLVARRFQCPARRHRRPHHASGDSSATGAGGQTHVAGDRAALRQTRPKVTAVAQTAARPENVSVQGPAEEVRRLAAVETLPRRCRRKPGRNQARVRLSNDGKPLIDHPGPGGCCRHDRRGAGQPGIRRGRSPRQRFQRCLHGHAASRCICGFPVLRARWQN